MTGTHGATTSVARRRIKPLPPVVNTTLFWGVNYNWNRSPNDLSCPPAAVIRDIVRKDLRVLASVTRRVRIYGMAGCDAGAIVVQETKALKFKLWLGMWINQYDAVFENEFQALQRLTRAGLSNVEGVIVGSETLYRKEVDAGYVASKLRTVRGFLWRRGLSRIVVTEADVSASLALPTVYPLLGPAVDWVALNEFPMWRGTPFNNSIAVLDAQYQRMRRRFNQFGLANGVLISESGWAWGGKRSIGRAVPSPANAIRYIRAFVCWARRNQVRHFYFAGLDANIPGPAGVENHWGLFTFDRQLKPGLRLPIRVRC